MHRATFKPGTLLGIAALFIGLGAITSAPRAQGPDQPPPGVLVLQTNATKQVSMSTNALLTSVAVENPKVCRVQTMLENPRAVLITGLNPGSTRVTLTDDKKNTESFEVRVLADEETAREQQRKDLIELIRKAVPTASVGVLTSPNNTVTLTGHVANAQTVNVIADLARSVFGGNAILINNIEIGGVQQVQIEVIVATVNRSEIRNFGFSFLETGKQHFVASQPGAAGSLVAATLTSVLNPAAALNASPNAIFGITNDKQGFVGFLQALRIEGLAKIYSEPYATTLSGRPGYIVSGGETPILTTSGTGAPNVTYKPFGTIVSFLPIVLEDGKIHLEVRPEISRINAANGINLPSAVGTTNVPGFDVRGAQVAVQIEDGQTLAIGGLVQSIVNATNNKVPLLGDIPFFGAAFSVKQYTESEEELIILVTPRLVHPLGCTQLPKYLPGRETRSADDFELFLEGIMEAPRGPRQVCPPYTASHMNGPTASVFPCANGACGVGQGRCVGNAQFAAPVSSALPGARLPMGNGNTRPMAETETPAAPVSQETRTPVDLPPVREQANTELPVLPPLSPRNDGPNGSQPPPPPR
ncbi:MAG: pilus assembly protein N-terminal domain-containing protein [Planctomycetes bacterium]|nr:pilus assembly protein N-terminal domain-containing protein [Planctomycetota bacterium]